MKILWFTWKDLKHPLAGGAEVVNEQLAKRLVADGHEVTLLVGGFKSGAKEETVDGYKIIRIGNRYSVYVLALIYYVKNLRGWADLVIEEINTVPFFTKFYSKEPSILLVHQLCREIWFYQFPPILSPIGYAVEPIYLWLLSNQKVITVSQSTKTDLTRYGFRADKISVISEGISIKPVQYPAKVQKYDKPTVLSLGTIRPMKRTADQIRAFELAKEQIPDLQLKVAGDANDPYGQKVLEMIAKSKYTKDIVFLGRVTEGQKIELMQKAHAILVTSVKEGWGLIVTEAASQGTPAIVYNVDGLRDSVQNNRTGWVVQKNTPACLADAISGAFTNPLSMSENAKQAHTWSQDITFERSYSDFKDALGFA